MLVRIDGAGGARKTIEALSRRRAACSAGLTLPHHMPQIYRMIPHSAWASVGRQKAVDEHSDDPPQRVGLGLQR